MGRREDSALGTQIHRQVSDQEQLGGSQAPAFLPLNPFFPPQMLATQAGKRGMNKLILRQQTQDREGILAVWLATETPLLDRQHLTAWSLLRQLCI